MAQKRRRGTGRMRPSVFVVCTRRLFLSCARVKERDKSNCWWPVTRVEWVKGMSKGDKEKGPAQRRRRGASRAKKHEKKRETTKEQEKEKGRANGSKSKRHGTRARTSTKPLVSFPFVLKALDLEPAGYVGERGHPQPPSTTEHAYIYTSIHLSSGTSRSFAFRFVSCRLAGSSPSYLSCRSPGRRYITPRRARVPNVMGAGHCPRNM